MSLARGLAEHVVQTDCGTLPAATLLTAKLHLLDGIGCMLAGGGSRVARIAQRLQFARGDSTIFATGCQVGARDAAFSNSAALYSIALNDVHKDAGAHPGATIIPALLALAERPNVAGADFLAGLVAGYDVMGRLGRAIMPQHRARGFHPTGTLGPFASTAAVGRLSGFDAELMASAFGIAGSQAAGLVCFLRDESDTIFFHAARSAENGVTACALAAAGLRGPKEVLEDPKGGFLATMSTHADAEAILRSGPYGHEVNASTLRPFYGCTYTIAATSAVEQIMARNPARTASEMQSITVRAHPALISEVDRPNPTSLLAARISMQFNIALALALGGPLLGEADESHLHDPILRQLMARITLHDDETLPAWGSAVQVTYRDGDVHDAMVQTASGDPEAPLEQNRVVRKFHALVGKTEAAAEVVRAVDRLDGDDCAELISAIAFAAGEMEEHALQHSPEARLA